MQARNVCTTILLTKAIVVHMRMGQQRGNRDKALGMPLAAVREKWSLSITSAQDIGMHHIVVDIVYS